MPASGHLAPPPALVGARRPPVGTSAACIIAPRIQLNSSAAKLLLRLPFRRLFVILLQVAVFASFRGCTREPHLMHFKSGSLNQSDQGKTQRFGAPQAPSVAPEPLVFCTAPIRLLAAQHMPVTLLLGNPASLCALPQEPLGRAAMPRVLCNLWSTMEGVAMRHMLCNQCSRQKLSGNAENPLLRHFSLCGNRLAQGGSVRLQRLLSRGRMRTNVAFSSPLLLAILCRAARPSAVDFTPSAFCCRTCLNSSLERVHRLVYIGSCDLILVSSQATLPTAC